MLILLMNLFIFMCLLFLGIYVLLMKVNRLNFFTFKINLFMNSFISDMKFMMYLIFILVLYLNILSMVPMMSSPTMYYCFTMTLAFVYWLAIMVCVSLTQIKEFISHLLPYGAPMSLSLFLPIVELFSQIIRPATLMIRLSTNLSSGHIMMYMFSYFTMKSSMLLPVIDFAMVFLYILEICICSLQAYIFTSLIMLYMVETT